MIGKLLGRQGKYERWSYFATLGSTPHTGRYVLRVSQDVRQDM